MSLLLFHLGANIAAIRTNEYFGGPSPSGTVWRANSRAADRGHFVVPRAKNVRSVLAQGTRRVRNSPTFHFLSPLRKIVVNYLLEDILWSKFLAKSRKSAAGLKCIPWKHKSFDVCIRTLQFLSPCSAQTKRFRESRHQGPYQPNLTLLAKNAAHKCLAV